MNHEQAQIVVDEISEILRKHDAVLIGCCLSECINSEIEIVSVMDAKTEGYSNNSNTLIPEKDLIRSASKFYLESLKQNLVNPS